VSKAIGWIPDGEWPAGRLVSGARGFVTDSEQIDRFSPGQGALQACLVVWNMGKSGDFV